MQKLKYLSFVLLLVSSTNYVLAQTDFSGREKIYRATHTKSTELQHTKLKVNFDYPKEQMNGEEWLTAAPFFYPSDSLVLDAKAMLIHEVALDKNGTKQALKYDYKNDMLKIKLGKTYKKGENYTVYIKYTSRPNEVTQKGSSAISDAKGLYFINAQGKDKTKPIQIWTQGETESSSAWFPTIDKPNQKTTQEIYMTVPDQYTTLSNGLLKSSEKAGNGLRTDHWVMDKKHAPYLFFMGVGEYAVVKDKWRNISVDYYVEKEYEPYAKQIFGNTPEMMEFFSKKLNYDFPWSKYAQIVGRDYVSGAMENTTATLHGESAQQKPGDLIDENRWENVIAHELFHQWFGDLVTTESWSNITVNESFANYSEYLWNEYKYGKESADYWLMNEIKGYRGNPENFNKNLVRFGYDQREDVFDAISYNKGGSILHMLRNFLGDDAFLQGLTEYLKTNEYGTGEAHQLRLAFEKISGKDLNWFFNQWYYGNGNPKISYSYTFEPIKKQINLIINQTGEAFQFPLSVDVYEKGQAKRHKVWVNAKDRNELTLPAQVNPDLVNLNADGVLVADIEESKNAQQYLLQFQNSKEFLSRYKALDFAINNKEKDANSLKILTLGVKDPFYQLKIMALDGLDLNQAEQSKANLSEVEKLAANDSKTLVQAAAIGALAKTNNKKYLSLFQNATNAVSNSVKSNAIIGLVELDPNISSKYINNIDLSKASEKTIEKLLPIIVDQKITSQLPYTAGFGSFYPFIKMSKPALGAYAEKAFNMVMGSDDLKSTENYTKLLNQVKSQVADNPQAKMMLVNILKEALAKKSDLLKENPKNSSLEEQASLIRKTIEAYTK